jgi:hypothetical protein
MDSIESEKIIVDFDYNSYINLSILYLDYLNWKQSV